ncbi:MAG: tetratricopeptide repeat protein, partial [Cyclobacteriaceae bacterium]
MRKCTWILSWLVCQSIVAQNASSSEIDSLRGIIREYSANFQDSKVAFATNALAYVFRENGEFDSAEFYFKESLQFSIRSGEKILTSRNYYEIGRINYRPKSEFDSAAHYFQLALSIAREIKDEQRTADSYFQLGVLASTQGNLSLALSNFQSALPSYQSLEDSLGIADVYNSIGVLYSKREDFDRSL